MRKLLLKLSDYESSTTGRSRLAMRESAQSEVPNRLADIEKDLEQASITLQQLSRQTAHLSNYLKQLTMTRPFSQGPRVMSQTKPFSTDSSDKAVIPGSTIESPDPKELSILRPKFVKREQGDRDPLVPTSRRQQSKARLLPGCQDSPSRHPSSNQRQGARRQFTLLPRSLSQVLPILWKKDLLSTESRRPNPERFSNYDPSKKCDYHMGEVGHSTDNCYVLKYKIQDLLDTGAFTFRASWLCQGRDDLLIVPNIRITFPGPAKMMFEEMEVIDTLGQPSGKFDYYVKYSAPPSFYLDPRDVIPDGWGGMDDPTPLNIEDPDDAIEGITTLFDDIFIGAVEKGPLKGMGTGPQE